MIRKIFPTLIIMLAMVTAVQICKPSKAEAEDVLAYTAPNMEYTVYVISESVGFTDNGTLKCRTKTVRGMEYDITGWELKKDGDIYYYRICESEGIRGLAPVEGKWRVLDSEEMLRVFSTCVDCLQE